MILKNYFIDYLSVLFLFIEIYQFNCQPLNVSSTNLDKLKLTNNLTKDEEINIIRNDKPPNQSNKFKLIIEQSSINKTNKSNDIHSLNEKKDEITKSIEMNKQSDKQLDKQLEELKQQSNKQNLDNQTSVKDNKLKRTKRRGGRIGGKSSASGIGHGRTGAKQDSANSQTTNQPKSFLLYLISFVAFNFIINLFNNQFKHKNV